VGFALGSRGGYAVRAMVHLARHRGTGRQKARAIAEAMDIPPAYLPQILGQLIRGGLVTSVAGPHGGYEIARDPSTITLLAVIEAVEGPVRSASCPVRGGPCRPEDPCVLHDQWGAAQDALSERLASSTFAAVPPAPETPTRGKPA
jgi:Rrf2 family transcriptional regulator, iron-sulfur cluster assembly transcription factor